MRLSSNCAAVVAKMIPLLGSDVDGEVVATVAALRRTLESDGKTLHDVAEIIAASIPKPQKAASFVPSSFGPPTRPVDISNYLYILNVVPFIEGITKPEREFVELMRRGARLQGAVFRMTEPQTEKWEKILTKAGL